MWPIFASIFAFVKGEQAIWCFLALYGWTRGGLLIQLRSQCLRFLRGWPGQLCSGEFNDLHCFRNKSFIGYPLGLKHFVAKCLGLAHQSRIVGGEDGPFILPEAGFVLDLGWRSLGLRSHCSSRCPPLLSFLERCW